MGTETALNNEIKLYNESMNNQMKLYNESIKHQCQIR